MSLILDVGLAPRPPYDLLLLGICAISAAALFACAGKVWVRFNGWVYRDKEPRPFWGNVACLFLGGVCFVGYFLYKIYGFPK